MPDSGPQDGGTARPRPLVGLSTYREPAAWGDWVEPADLLPATYADAVSDAGGLPLLLPAAGGGAAGGARADAQAGAHDAVAALDGLVLTGGPDVDPARYGASRGAHTGLPRPERDAWEIALVRAALALDLPVLAICRGMQVLAVAAGGTLVQHLPEIVGHDAHRPVVGAHGRHELLIGAGRLRDTLGDRVTVATYHHQAVDEPGAGLLATAWAADGTIEAIEHDAATWVVGVQWHPEAYDGAALFGAFVQACAALHRTDVVL